MGRTIDEWRSKVAGLLRDEAGLDLSSSQLDDAALRPAFSEHSEHHPARLFAEITGAGSSYIDMPIGWIEDWSDILSIEYPARQNPPLHLDSCRWRLTAESPRRILLLDATPSVSEYLRIEFVGEWPFPNSDPATDLLPTRRFEAVAKLAAAHACSSLAAEAARGLTGGMEYEGTSRTTELRAAADGFRDDYLKAFVGVGVG